jgi:hypothetical protein
MQISRTRIDRDSIRIPAYRLCEYGSAAGHDSGLRQTARWGVDPVPVPTAPELLVGAAVEPLSTAATRGMSAPTGPPSVPEVRNGDAAISD